MTLIQSIVLAIVQGVTEFLPVSSTGHVNLLSHFFGVTPSLSFDIFLNTASLLAVLIYFRHQTNFFFKNIHFIFLGTIPALIVGLLFKDQIESIFSNIKTLPYEFLFTFVILYSTRFFTKSGKSLNYKNALVIGIFQALAIIPAVSRSGSTIFGGLLFGLDPQLAFNFSFSLFIPASIGALILDLANSNIQSYFNFQSLIIFLACFTTSYGSLHLLSKIMVNRQLYLFSYYCLILGIALIFAL